jgi:Cu/Ag efflux pump CusA
MQAAVDAGYARLRPVCMTALAMIIGMLPMALGIGEGGEQNAPLGRAVIGGLLVATVFTLIIVPVIYSMLRQDATVVDGAGIRPPAGAPGTPTLQPAMSMSGRPQTN